MVPYNILLHFSTDSVTTIEGVIEKFPPRDPIANYMF